MRTVVNDVRALVLLLELQGTKAANELEGEYCEEESGKFKIKAIPRSTKYRLLKRLAEMGYLEQLQGVDKRYRYYKLSQLGIEYKQLILKRLLEKLRKLQGSSFLLGTLEIPWSSFQQLSCSYGIPPKLLLKLLNAKIEQRLSNKVVVIEKRD